MQKLSVILLIVILFALGAAAAELEGELGIGLENSNHTTTLALTKCALTVSGKLEAYSAQVIVDFKGDVIEEAYLQMDSLQVGKDKMSFGIGNYGIGAPNIVKKRDGKSATGLWLSGEVDAGAYKILLYDTEEQQQLLWLKYKLLPKLDLYGTYLFSDAQQSTSFGLQYKEVPFKISAEYNQVETVGDPKQLIMRGEYQLPFDWQFYFVSSRIYKNANDHPKTHEETIIGTKYTIAQGLDWETEYSYEAGEEPVLFSRLRARF